MRKLYFIGYPRLRISGGADGKVVDHPRHRSAGHRSSVGIIENLSQRPATESNNRKVTSMVENIISGLYLVGDVALLGFLEALAMDVIRPALQKAKLAWHGWHPFRRGLATNLHILGVSDKVIQQILRHANVSTTTNIYVKTVSADAANAMKSPETMCATTVQPEVLRHCALDVF